MIYSTLCATHGKQRQSYLITFPIRTKMSITSILQMKHVGLCTRPIFSQSLRLRVPAFCIGAIMVLCLIAIV